MAPPSQGDEIVVNMFGQGARRMRILDLLARDEGSEVGARQLCAVSVAVTDVAFTSPMLPSRG